jgi:hypothetical protein
MPQSSHQADANTFIDTRYDGSPSPLNPFEDQNDYQSRSPSPNPFAHEEDHHSLLTINLQGTSDPYKAASDLKDVLQKVVPGTGVTLVEGRLADIRVPDDYIVERKSHHDLGDVTNRDDVCAISVAASGTGDTYVQPNHTAFVAHWNINTLEIYDDVDHSIDEDKEVDGQRRLDLFPTRAPAHSQATGPGIVSERTDPQGQYGFASSQSLAWAGRKLDENCT